MRRRQSSPCGRVEDVRAAAQQQLLSSRLHERDRCERLHAWRGGSCGRYRRGKGGRVTWGESGALPRTPSQGCGGAPSTGVCRKTSDGVLEPRAPARRRSAASRDILSSWSVDAEARCPARRRVGTGFARAEGVRRSDALLLWLSLCSLRRRASFPASLCLWCLVVCTHMQRMGWEGGARRMPGHGPRRVACRRGRAPHHSNLISWPSLGRGGGGVGQ